jgi:hypothetical protein
VGDKQRGYHAYLLRLWKVQAPEAPVWRSSLEEPGNGMKKTFASLATLFAFLEEQTGDGDPRHQVNIEEPPDSRHGEPCDLSQDR